MLLYEQATVRMRVFVPVVVYSLGMLASAVIGLVGFFFFKQKTAYEI